VVFFLAAPIAALFASHALGHEHRSMRMFSWIVAIVWLAITVVGIPLQSRGLQPGLYQRVVEVASTLWFVVFGLWMTRRALRLRTAFGTVS
jgi:ABC-type nickel/cobalt efflux system permease component RcnA